MPAAAPIPTPADFVKKWTIRFADNEYQRITEGTFREFAADIAAVFGVQLVNVPVYQVGTPYQDGYLVRFTPDGGKESFFYSLQPGILPAPTTNSSDKYWRLVPGPVSTVALSQELTLSQAQSIEGLLVVAGRSYIIDFGPDANGHAQLVTLLGTAANLFAIRGQLTVAGVRSNVRVNVASGVFGQEVSNLLDTANAWKERQTFLKGLGFFGGAGFDEYGQLTVGQLLLADKFLWRGNVQKMAQDVLVGWSPDDYAGQGHGPDAALGRAAAGVVEVNTGVAGSLAKLAALDFLASAAPDAYNSFTKLVNKMIANEARLGSTTPTNTAVTTSTFNSLQSSFYGLSDRLDLLARYIIRWDQEKNVTLDYDYQSALNYVSGQAFAYTSGTYAAGLITLKAPDYGRRGDLVGVRIKVGSKDLVFNPGRADGFGSAAGPKTMPALAGMQYIFHLVRPDANNDTGSYWVVHSTPSAAGASGTSYTDAQARAAQLARTAAAGTTTVTLTAESAIDYGTAASGSYTVDGTGCVVGKEAYFCIGTGGSAPVFSNAPSGQAFDTALAVFAPGKLNRYAVRVFPDRIEVLNLAR